MSTAISTPKSASPQTAEIATPDRHSSPGRVLITGGSSGLGAAIVSAVSAAGGTPIVLDLVGSEASSSYEVDVSDTANAGAVVAAAAEAHGGLDAIVTAAGIDRCGRLEDVDRVEWERVIMVNLLGTVGIVRAALPYLKQSHGRVITVASSLGLKAVPDATAYCASKFGIIGFTRALAAEMRGEIGVTALVPAGMRTHFFDNRDEKYRPHDNSKLNDPARVAEAVLFVLGQPRGCEVRELVIAQEEDDSWP